MGGIHKSIKYKIQIFAFFIFIFIIIIIRIKGLIMTEQEKIDDVIWAREMLRFFAVVEHELKEELGSFGIAKIVIKNPLIIALFFFSLLISIFGCFFLIGEKKPIYIFAVLLPIISVSYIYFLIREEKKKNIFRFLGKTIEPQAMLLLHIEEYVFKNREMLEEIIAWKVNSSSKNEQSRYAKMFDSSAWLDVTKAQTQCLILAILMVSVQRFMHKNRNIYNEQVKKLPLMNEGYKYKSSKMKSGPINQEDIQTFGGFT